MVTVCNVLMQVGQLQGHLIETYRIFGDIVVGACCGELQEVDPAAFRTVGGPGFAHPGAF